MTRRHTIRPRRIFFDLEAGGLNPETHPIIQIAAVAFDTDWREIERFEVKIKFDEADCEADTLKKVHYDRRLWMHHAVEPLTAHQRFCYFLREHATVSKFSQKKNVPYHVARLFAHNAKFDSAFLWRWHDLLRAENPGLFLPADPLFVCTLQTALIFFDQDVSVSYQLPVDYKLGTLCDYFKIPFSTNEAHDAMFDCLATAQLYHAMTVGQKQEIRFQHAA